MEIIFTEKFPYEDFEISFRFWIASLCTISAGETIICSDHVICYLEQVWWWCRFNCLLRHLPVVSELQVRPLMRDVVQRDTDTAKNNPAMMTVSLQLNSELSFEIL